MNRKQLALLAMTLLTMATTNLIAQDLGPLEPPQVIPYQGYIDADGVPINTALVMRFSLHQTLDGDPALFLWQEQQVLSVNMGRFGTAFGTAALNPLPTDLFEYDFLFLQIELQDALGEWVTLTARQRLTPVPYAYLAGHALQSDHAADAITSVTAGPGLAGGGDVGDINLSVTFAGSGSATTVARSDHNRHDQLWLRYQRDNAAEVLVAHDTRPYHLSLTAPAYHRSTRQIPQEVINDLCGDPDGCIVRLGMTRWTSDTYTEAASRGPYIFYYTISNGRWRLSDTDASGVDGDGTTQHVMGPWSMCYFTDGVYVSGTDTGDSARGMNLLVWNGDGYTGANRTCELTIED